MRYLKEYNYIKESNGGYYDSLDFNGYHSYLSKMVFFTEDEIKSFNRLFIVMAFQDNDGNIIINNKFSDGLTKVIKVIIRVGGDNFHITSMGDEWYIVSAGSKEYYKCDQLEGLVKLIKYLELN
jgi:hypothetical protein